MKMPKWILLVFLLLAACHEDDDKEKETVAKIEYTPPDCSKDYKEIYTQPMSEDRVSYIGNNGIFGFTKPEDPKQKEHWVEVDRRKDGPVGHIKALEDGRVEISALMITYRDTETAEIGLIIGDKEEPIETFNTTNLKFIGESGQYRERYYQIQTSAPIKKGEKILFKHIMSAFLAHVKICFKPKEDKKSNQLAGAGDQATKQDKSQEQNPPNQGGGSDPNIQDNKNDEKEDR